MKKKRKQYLRSVVLVIVALVLLLDLFLFLTKDKEYSQIENRNLETRPALSWTEILSGRYESNYESYVADQFPLRTTWIQLKTFVDRLMGKTESSGIFLGKDGYLMEDFTPPEESDYQQLLAALQSFSTRHSNLNQYFLAAPTAVSVLSNKLPAHAITGDENAYLDRLAKDLPAEVTFVDVRPALQAAAETGQVYYRTDHHWTTQGAYAAYQTFAQAAQLTGLDTVYQPTLVSDSFSGTLTASSGFRMGETDEVYVYLPQEEKVDYVVSYVEEGEKSASFYHTENLSLRDHYTLFFNGNHPLVRIDTTSETGRVLLVLKDSYANCFVPFLTEDYSEILMVDPRYYADDLELLISTEQVTDILYLYNANSLASDGNLQTVIAPNG